MQPIVKSHIPLLVFACITLLASIFATGALIWASQQNEVSVATNQIAVASSQDLHQDPGTAKLSATSNIQNNSRKPLAGGATFTVKPYVSVSMSTKPNSQNVAVVNTSNEYSVRVYPVLALQ